MDFGLAFCSSSAVCARPPDHTTSPALPCRPPHPTDSLPNPFAVVTCDGAQTFTTQVVKKTLNPYWSESVDLCVASPLVLSAPPLVRRLIAGRTLYDDSEVKDSSVVSVQVGPSRHCLASSGPEPDAMLHPCARVDRSLITASSRSATRASSASSMSRCRTCSTSMAEDMVRRRRFFVRRLRVVRSRALTTPACTLPTSLVVACRDADARPQEVERRLARPRKDYRLALDQHCDGGGWKRCAGYQLDLGDACCCCCSVGCRCRLSVVVDGWRVELEPDVA